MARRLIWVVLFVLGAAVGASATFTYARNTIANRPQPAFHEHADFALFLSGKRFDFSRDEFMSNKPCVLQTRFGWIRAASAHGFNLDESVHLHDNNGSIVHVHREGITWHDFFESLRLGFENDFFADREGNQYKNDESNAFVFLVNGTNVDDLADREIREGDQVLISYGRRDRDAAEIAAEDGQVSNDACFLSGTCKHRGFAPAESCGAEGAAAQPAVLRWLGL